MLIHVLRRGTLIPKALYLSLTLTLYLMLVECSSEKTDEEDHYQYLTLFNDHLEGDEIPINPRSIPRMRVGKASLHR